MILQGNSYGKGGGTNSNSNFRNFSRKEFTRNPRKEGYVFLAPMFSESSLDTGPRIDNLSNLLQISEVSFPSYAKWKEKV